MAPKKVATHPPYSVMVKDALLALKERNGSSPAALKKKIGEQHPGLPTGWEKVLSTQLRNLVKSGKLVKVGSPSSGLGPGNIRTRHRTDVSLQ